MSVTENVEKAIGTMATRIAHGSPFDKTRSGVITNRNDNNKYDVLIDGVKYTDIPIINNFVAQVGDIVRVVYPTNNTSQMFIYGIQANSSWGIDTNLFTDNLLIDGGQDMRNALYDLGWFETTQDITIDTDYHGSWTPTNDTVNGYSIYASKDSWHVGNAWDTAKITFSGFAVFNIYIRSYGENNYDYMLVSTLNNDYLANRTSTSNMRSIRDNVQYTKAHTRGEASPTDYKLVSFDGLNPKQSYYFYVIYQKDSSTDSNADRGYFYIAT